MAIRFQSSDVRFSIKRKKDLTDFIEKQLSKQAAEVEVDYIFCSDQLLLEMNMKFLKHDTYTDILTFPLTKNKKLLRAEIYISVERVKDNAQKMDVKFDEEILRVVFHGALHLIGFKDKIKADKAKMRRAEDRWLDSFMM